MSRPIKTDLVSSWDGMSQLSQISVMFVVNLKKSFKVIVKSEKIEQNKPDRQMYERGGAWITVEPI